MNKEKALLLDVTYFDELDSSIISLFVQNKGKHFWLKDKKFRPYLYVTCAEKEKKKTIKELSDYVFGFEEKFKVLRVEDTGLIHNSKEVLKLIFGKVTYLVAARKFLSELGFEKYEYDVPYAKRYLLDTRLEPGNWIEYDIVDEEEFLIETKKENKKNFENSEEEEEAFTDISLEGKARVIENIKVVDGDFEGWAMAFDLETFSGKKFAIGAEPILMTSIVANDLNLDSKSKNYERVISYDTVKVDGLEMLKDEKELVEETIKELNTPKNSFIITYNGDNFDFAYTKDRAKKLGVEFKVNGATPRTMRHGLDNATKLSGIQHIDSFQIIKLLARTGAINTVKMDIESVSEKVFGEFKEKVYPSEINEAWEGKDKKKMERLVDYNLKDSRTALRIAKDFLPLFVEISKLTSQTLYETTRNSTSQMVEDLLLKEAHSRGMIAPNKPKEPEIQERSTNPIKGAFVKEPISGLHEDIAILDFASLYPSIIISHNLSPDTLNCTHPECKEKNSTPDGTWFCTKTKGLFPEILEKMLKQRLVLKKEYKRKKKEGIDDKILFAKQWALKIVLNSVYGYLAYARARWYSRECASATTALARGYIQATIKKAEEEGFKVLYGDSITKDRFVTVLNPKGKIEVINIEDLFEQSKGFLTQRSGKEVRLIQGYKALSVNKETLLPEWAKIKEIIRHKTKKKIYRVHQKYGETICTQDHSLMILNKDNKLIEKKPTEMSNEKLFSVTNIPSSREVTQIDLFELLKNYKYTRQYKGVNEFSQWHEKEGYLWFGFFNIKNQIKIKRFIEVNSSEFVSLCKLLGAYIPEGSSSTIETSKSKFGASIASSNVNWLKGIEEDYHNLFINAKTCVIKSTKKIRTLTYGVGKKMAVYEDHTHKLQMMNETTAVFFKQLCGQKSRGKNLPQFIFNVPSKYKTILLEKMVEGDGSHAVNKKLAYTKEYIKKNFSYTTNSIGLISGLSLLLRQMGRNYSIQFREDKKAYTLKTCDKMNEKFKTKIIKENYGGFVYDLSVEKNNNFVDACGQVLLHNTDSTFLLMNKKTKKDVEEFAETVNKNLPEGMELELDGFYKRGIFVTKKEGGAAKKKYALIDEKGNLKIVGFEYVRRDWCNAAKDTQKKVIELVLNEGKPEKAISFVKKMLADLKEGRVPKKDLVIMTLLQRDIKDYDAIGPHVAAAKKAIKRGKELGVGSMLSFIITKGKGKMSISDKAELEEYVSEGDYDANYYIENQVLPAVIKIMQELGYTKEDLINGGKQSGLGSWC